MVETPVYPALKTNQQQIAIQLLCCWGFTTNQPSLYILYYLPPPLPAAARCGL